MPQFAPFVSLHGHSCLSFDFASYVNSPCVLPEYTRRSNPCPSGMENGLSTCQSLTEYVLKVQTGGREPEQTPKIRIQSSTECRVKQSHFSYKKGYLFPHSASQEVFSTQLFRFMHSFLGLFLISFEAIGTCLMSSSTFQSQLFQANSRTLLHVDLILHPLVSFTCIFLFLPFVIPLVPTINDSSGDSFEQIFAIHQNVSRFKSLLFCQVFYYLFNIFQRNLRLLSYSSKFVLQVSSLFPPPLCPQITPWSQRAEGCIFSSRPATSSREPAAPGW